MKEGKQIKNFLAFSLQRQRALSLSRRSTNILVVTAAFSLYATARTLLFASYPTLLLQDSYMWVSPNDPTSEILSGNSNRPGFLYQLALRLFDQIDLNLIPIPPDGHFKTVPEVMPITILSLALSVCAWFFFAFGIARLLNRGVRGQIVAGVSLAPSFMPAVAMWDRAIMSESFSISLTIAWMGSLALIFSNSSNLRHLSLGVFLGAAMMAVRPSHFVVVIPVLALVFVTVLVFRRNFVKARLQSIGILAVVLASISSLTIVEAIKWSAKYESIVSSNRATSLLVFPSFQEHLSEVSGREVCPSAIDFAQRMWLEENHGSWGGVTGASENEVEYSGCIGSWRELGDSSPSLVQTLTLPRVQFDYWANGGVKVALDGKPLLGFLDDLSIHNNQAFPSVSLIVGSFLYSSIVSAVVFPLMLGLGLRLLLPRTRADSSRTPFLWAGAMLAISIGAMWLMAFADGGDPYRHAVPYNVVIPIFSMLVGYTSGYARIVVAREY